MFDTRHILLKAEPNAEEIATAKQKWNKLEKDILEGKTTFKRCSLKHSDEKYQV